MDWILYHQVCLMMSDHWQITEAHFNPSELHYKETLFAIGNGYLGTRGSFEESYPQEQAATLVHGVFDDVPVFYTELANTPNWTSLEVVLNGERFRLDRGQILDYSRRLDLRDATLIRSVRWQSPNGLVTRLEFNRFASLADEHILAVSVEITPEGWMGEVEIRANLPGTVNNDGLVHLMPVAQGQIDRQSAFLSVQTKASQIDLYEAFYLQAGPGAKYSYWDSMNQPALIARCKAGEGETIHAEKLVTIFTSRDVPQPELAAREKLFQASAAGWSKLRIANSEAWKQEWERCNITIEGDDEADLALRYSIYQLLIAAPRNDDRVSIPAKSLTGYGYRGHVFWDTEIFALPFFIYTSPKIARNLLMYRYHTLSGARRKAHEYGLEGAMYAWESAASGDENTPRWVTGPDSADLIRIWPGDIEIHISADVAYAVLQYWQVSGDDEFMREFGAEIVLDTARFWGSRAEWNAQRSRYEINGVIGPDENHDHVNNNVFTNHMACWNLQAGLDILAWLKKHAPQQAEWLASQLDLNPERLDHWRDVIAKMYIGYDPSTRLYEQFDGFFELESVNQQDYEPRVKSFQALFGIEGVQAYQLIKQPDVLMMFFLHPHDFDDARLKANWNYYTPRTDLSLGSSLGPAVQAILAGWLGEKAAAYQHFIHAARTDLEDARGNTRDGSHAATHGGLWQAAVLGFAGLNFTANGPQTQPALPQGWTRLAFQIQYHGRAYPFDLHAGGQPAQVSPNGHKKEELPHPHIPILGAIFDLDGVLTDTSEFHYLAWKRLADEEGIPFDREANEQLRGIDRRDSLLRLLNGRSFPEEKLQEMMDRKNRYYLDLIAGITPQDLLPGAGNFLDQLHAAGIKIAIGSASKNARSVIEKLGLQSQIDAIADGNSVERQKPFPDLFLHAASLLNLRPQHCIVFEDAGAGVEAALAGNMWAVGLGPQERVGQAHLTFDNLDGLQWESISKALEKIQLEMNPG